MDATSRPTPEPVVRETHSAVVVLLGDRVYKAKKPVRLPFLDFSTLEARRAVARREVELNRRLAPDVYLGVGEWRAPDAPDAAAEPVVVMRRMPEDRRLATLVAHDARVDGAGTPSEPLADAIRAIARAVAAFHARAERSPTIDTAGRPTTVTGKFTTDVAEARAVAAGVLDPATLDRVDRLGRTYLAGRGPLLAARVRAGLVCDGHGDLLADDIFCLDDGPRILDCIEFDDRLRWGDVLADVAFLAMDLERLGAAPLAAALLADYGELSGERHPASLAHFYVASRALIRAKVTAVRAHQGETDAPPLAARLLDLAADHLHRGRVTCTLVGGTPGTGKSTLAHALAPLLDAVVVSSDEARKDLAGLPHHERAESAYGTGLYDDAHTDATYAEVVARARRLLEHGTSVVLDASWTRRPSRDLARDLAAGTSSVVTELRCVAAADSAERRIAHRRLRGPTVSDATAEVARVMTGRADPWPEATVIDTDAALDRCIEAARGAVG